jgi:hypothetical protein
LALTMADSDSDDSFANVQIFRPKRRNRCEEKRIAKGSAFLDDALAHVDRLCENGDRIAKIKEENPDLEADENILKAKVDALIAEKKTAPAKAKAAEVRDSIRDGYILEDQENVLTREQRVDLGQAKETEVSSNLGVRRTLIFEPEEVPEGNTACYFDKQTNSATLIKELKDCLAKHVSPQNKTLQVAWIQPIRKLNKSKIMEWKYLLEQNELARSRHAHNLKDIPTDVLLWLFRVACGPDTEEVPFREGSFKTLTTLLRQNKSIMEKQEKSNISDEGQEDLGSSLRPSFFHLAELAVQLQSWVSLASSQTTKDSSNEDSRMSDVDECNANGFRRFLELWITAFDFDQVSLRKGESVAEDATLCLVLLAKAALDASVHSSEM